MLRLILGSQSPRRKEILSHFNIPFEQAFPPFNEDAVPFRGHPGEYVCELSKGKADSLYPLYQDAAILTADSVVFKDGIIFGKPKDRGNAVQTLQALANAWHTVYTGVTIRFKEKEFHQFEETRVLFNKLTPAQIDLYIERLKCSDKAGGYGIQMGAGIVIKRIEGCYTNVMGLPVNTLCELMSKIGVDLWHHLKS